MRKMKDEYFILSVMRDEIFKPVLSHFFHGFNFANFLPRSASTDFHGLVIRRLSCSTLAISSLFRNGDKRGLVSIFVRARSEEMKEDFCVTEDMCQF